MGQQPVPAYYNWLWNCTCQPRHKIFFWLLLKDRINTRNILRRKNCPLDDFSCLLCDQDMEETVHHLFWNCSFAQQCWGLICPLSMPNLPTHQILFHLKDRIGLSFSMELIILAAWALWITRNNCIFNQQTPNIQGWRDIFTREVSLLTHRAKPSLKQLISTWLSNLPSWDPELSAPLCIAPVIPPPCNSSSLFLVFCFCFCNYLLYLIYTEGLSLLFYIKKKFF